MRPVLVLPALLQHRHVLSRELLHSMMWMLQTPLTGVTARVPNKLYPLGDLLPELDKSSRLAYVIWRRI